MSDFNEEYKKQGRLEVEVWHQNRLADLFEQHFFDLSIYPPKSIDSFCRTLLSIKDYTYNKKELIDFK
jgi:hypothetical protein